MAQQYYKTKEVTGVSNQEVLEKLLTSTEEENKVLKGIFVTETTATENNDARIRLYLEREKLIDFDIRHLISAQDNASRQTENPYIPVNVDIPVGQTIQVGHVSGGTASNVSYTVVYEIA